MYFGNGSQNDDFISMDWSYHQKLPSYNQEGNLVRSGTNKSKIRNFQEMNQEKNIGYVSSKLTKTCNSLSLKWDKVMWKANIFMHVFLFLIFYIWYIFK